MRRNKYRQIKTTCALAIVLTLNFLQTEAAAQMAEVNMGVGFVNARVAPLWAAEKEGFFKKNGVDIKVLKLAGELKGLRRCLAAASTSAIPTQPPPSPRLRPALHSSKLWRS